MKEIDTVEEKLSPTLENYLEIIFVEEYKEGAARTGNIAQKAEVSASTVTSALKTLQKLGYITYLPYKFIHLTDKGRKVASNIIHKHNVLLEFFTTILSIESEKAEKISCDIEHFLDDETFTKLRKFVFHTVNNVQFLENLNQCMNSNINTNNHANINSAKISSNNFS